MEVTMFGKKMSKNPLKSMDDKMRRITNPGKKFKFGNPGKTPKIGMLKKKVSKMPKKGY